MSISNLFNENLFSVYARRFLSNIFDTSNGGAMNIGALNASSINIGTPSTNPVILFNGLPLQRLVLGAVGTSPNANGALITGNTLTLEPAALGLPGILSNTTQTISGVKQIPQGIGLGNISGNLTISNMMTNYYKTVAPISVVWDPLGLLFATGPKTSTIECERIGNKIFITVVGIFGFPLGTPQNIATDIGVVPAEFRPSTIQFSTALVVNGYQDPSPSLQMTSGNNTIIGGFFLNSQGRLTCGTAQGVRIGPLNNSGDTLYPFQGPLEVGFVSQTLVFNMN